MNAVLFRLAAISMNMTYIIALVFGGVYYFMYFDDGSRIQTQITATIGELNIELESKKKSDQARQDLENMKLQVRGLSEQFEMASSQLPPQILTSDILKDIDRVSKISNVSVENKEPLKKVGYDIFQEYPMKISFKARYNEIGLFIFNIATQQRIMRVSDFTVTASTSTDLNEKKRLSFAGTVSSYSYVPPEEPALAPGAKGPVPPKAGGAVK